MHRLSALSLYGASAGFAIDACDTSRAVTQGPNLPLNVREELESVIVAASAVIALDQQPPDRQNPEMRHAKILKSQSIVILWRKLNRTLTLKNVCQSRGQTTTNALREDEVFFIYFYFVRARLKYVYDPCLNRGRGQGVMHHMSPLSPVPSEESARERERARARERERKREQHTRKRKLNSKP